ncbi:hypothetical protein ACROYT_G014753 [Oculina patagonica]
MTPSWLLKGNGLILLPLRFDKGTQQCHPEGIRKAEASRHEMLAGPHKENLAEVAASGPDEVFEDVEIDMVFVDVEMDKAVAVT